LKPFASQVADGKPTPKKPRSEFLDALLKGALLGGVALVIALPWLQSRKPAVTVPAPPVAVTPAPVTPPPASVPEVVPTPPVEVRVADFGAHEPSPDARRMANWIVQAADNKKHSFVIVDKKDARVYVFDGKGRLKDNTPALLGSANGDDTVPGIGDKPLSQVKPHEKTTPAGRFIAELGVNTKGEDIVWVDYDAAVSMHRVRANVKAERRLERLASPSVEDNRISFGCINLPKPFYEKVLQPTVKAGQTVIYVLPETRPLEKVFASFRDTSQAATLAQR